MRRWKVFESREKCWMGDRNFLWWSETENRMASSGSAVWRAISRKVHFSTSCSSPNILYVSLVQHSELGQSRNWTYYTTPSVISVERLHWEYRSLWQSVGSRLNTKCRALCSKDRRHQESESKSITSKFDTSSANGMRVSNFVILSSIIRKQWRKIVGYLYGTVLPSVSAGKREKPSGKRS